MASSKDSLRHTKFSKIKSVHSCFFRCSHVSLTLKHALTSVVVFVPKSCPKV